MSIVSQRDAKWSGIKLGTSSVTIGGYGCTITSLGYLVGLTPDKVNERMNAVGGYANGNLVIWSKVKEAIGVECYRYTSYNNDVVKEAISKNGAVLGEVNATAIGGSGKHWVVMVGGGKVQDPWFGEERSTSNYAFTGFTTVVFNKSKLGQYTIPQSQESLEAQIARLKTDLEAKTITNQNLEGQVSGLLEDIKKLKKSLAECENKPAQIVEKEIIKEIPVEIIKEVPVEKIVEKIISIPDPIREEIRDIFAGSGWWWQKYYKIKILVG